MRSLLLEDSKTCQARFSRLSDKDSNLRFSLVTSVRESALEYLCLNMDEEDLPSGFDPSTNEGDDSPMLLADYGSSTLGDRTVLIPLCLQVGSG